MFRETKMTIRQLNMVLKNAKFHSVKELALMSELTVSVVNTILKRFNLKEKGDEKINN